MSNKAIVIARVTMTHKNGAQTIIEVDSGVGFHNFYHWYRRLASRRDKTHLRSSNRNDAPDLAALAARVKAQTEQMARIPSGFDRKLSAERSEGQVVAIKLIVFKKKLYKRLLKCAPTELPGGIPTMHSRGGVIEPRFVGRDAPRLGHTSIARKWAILTGKA